MIFLVALGSLLVGALAGALLFKRFGSDEIRVQRLEAQLQELSSEHAAYKAQVNHHFTDSVVLINNLTRSYRDVFQHIASGAEALCPDHIAKQVAAVPLGLESGDLRRTTSLRPDLPPLDYANPDLLPDEEAADRVDPEIYRR